jgi:hypothetical protein
LDAYPGEDGNGNPTFDANNRLVTLVPVDSGSLGSVFGSIGHTAADNRQLQFALKLIW